MKAVVIREHGGLDTLRLDEVPTPRPGPGEVLLRVRAVALNNMDVWARSGPPGGRPIFPWGRWKLPMITGGDVAGVVEEVGTGVTEVAPGDRVVVNPILSCGRCAFCLAGEQSMCPEYRIFGEHRPGGMAEYTVVPAANALRIPDGVTFEAAAAAPACYTTAWRGLITAGRLQAGEELLVVGASGGVGTAALTIGRFAGARVFALVGNAEKAAKAERLGATPINRSEHPKFSERVRELTGTGVHMVSDPVGAATWPESIRSLRPGGRMVICGASGGERPDFDIRELYQRHRRILGAPMGNVTDFLTVMGLIFRGAITPVIHTVLPLAEVREAHRIFESREHFGKIVLVP
ncbi:MAG: alcohol dehydrogenase catalytic domain-containing protein [Armatimonadota bacterium]|nr:alcohol dehydrogenase catalytic domain-containing protein [Armatimonadota bacterium]MDR7450716.1 alcohol dehydrogenase catalytic domain-containing protein [Armatimonadota bacterium]MDR7466072.1 alcohol dehydrogenase catalytic domain-containing protein [Armatimonadota bacterium]MDR7493891.1 alcohol dehydrogenase catalytic domain-containing protein [Armatimonadota bacterium]MDR7503996.1 alcohol dehydrogenase catalytic domain-containing protein [Armatimonadota bacterium]